MADQRERGIFSLLRNAGAYDLLQNLLGARTVRENFAREYIRAQRGDRVLDIGCGTGMILAHLPAVQYDGYEPNAAYIKRARRAFSAKGAFHVGYFRKEDAENATPYNVIILSAVLHHLADPDAVELFALLRSVLRPGGRVVTLDNVIVEGQSKLARALIKFDRGRHVRSPADYLSLARPSFTKVSGDVRHRKFPPSTYFYMTAR